MGALELRGCSFFLSEIICLVVLEATSGRFPGTAGGFMVVILSFDFAFEFLEDFVGVDFGTSRDSFGSSCGVSEATFVDFPGFFVNF